MVDFSISFNLLFLGFLDVSLSWSTSATVHRSFLELLLESVTHSAPQFCIP